MSDFQELPPDQMSGFLPPGDLAWRDWFLRLQAFLQGVVKTADDAEALGIAINGGTP